MQKKYIFIAIIAGVVALTAVFYWLGSIEEEVAAVVSDDGVLTLTISAAALPEGVSLDQISIKKYGGEPPAGEYIRYQLSPDGLTFAQPITVATVVPDALDYLPIVYLLSGEQAEVAMDQEVIIKPASGQAIVRAQIQHFSDLVIGKGPKQEETKKKDLIDELLEKQFAAYLNQRFSLPVPEYDFEDHPFITDHLIITPPGAPTAVIETDGAVEQIGGADDSSDTIFRCRDIGAGSVRIGLEYEFPLPIIDPDQGDSWQLKIAVDYDVSCVVEPAESVAAVGGDSEESVPIHPKAVPSDAHLQFETKAGPFDITVYTVPEKRVIVGDGVQIFLDIRNHSRYEEENESGDRFFGESDSASLTRGNWSAERDIFKPHSVFIEDVDKFFVINITESLFVCEKPGTELFIFSGDLTNFGDHFKTTNWGPNKGKTSRLSAKSHYRVSPVDGTYVGFEINCVTSESVFGAPPEPEKNPVTPKPPGGPPPPTTANRCEAVCGAGRVKSADSLEACSDTSQEFLCIQNKKACFNYLVPVGWQNDSGCCCVDQYVETSAAGRIDCSKFVGWDINGFAVTKNVKYPADSSTLPPSECQ